ncbi:MAG: hypothetical protein B5M56_04330 [Desulfococcus sp. 4484_241]|nr:MAG: hypothetical protein B5M56_04330 [Desulfococcus sp. 4484_241]
MDPLNLIYDLARGPLVWVAFAVFIVGSAAQLVRMWRLTSPPDETYVPRVKKADGKNKLPLSYRIRLSVAGSSPVTVAVTTLFHLCLVITPLFVLGHNILLDNAWRVSLCSFPERFSDVLTTVVIICAGYFLARRVFSERVRIISSFWDYLFLGLAAGPFITGYLAYHQICDYKLVITVHMLLGEAMLVAIPFTKFVHMLFFFVFRFAVASEYSLGNGKRRW